MKVFGREPALWVGIITSCIIAVLQVLTGSEVISTSSADAITNLANSIGSIVTILAPLVAGLVIKQGVTPVASPVLPANTVVSTPEGVTALVKPIVPFPPGGGPG